MSSSSNHPIKSLIRHAKQDLAKEIRMFKGAHKKKVMEAPLALRVWGQHAALGQTPQRIRETLLRMDGTSREQFIRRHWEWTTAEILKSTMGNLFRSVSDWKELKGYYPHTFHQALVVHHQDGSFFHLPNACYARVGHALVIWTEHCGYHLFSQDDLEHWRIYPQLREGGYEPLEEIK